MTMVSSWHLGFIATRIIAPRFVNVNLNEEAQRMKLLRRLVPFRLYLWTIMVARVVALLLITVRPFHEKRPIYYGRHGRESGAGRQQGLPLRLPPQPPPSLHRIGEKMCTRTYKKTKENNTKTTTTSSITPYSYLIYCLNTFLPLFCTLFICLYYV